MGLVFVNQNAFSVYTIIPNFSFKFEYIFTFILVRYFKIVVEKRRRTDLDVYCSGLQTWKQCFCFVLVLFDENDRLGSGSVLFLEDCSCEYRQPFSHGFEKDSRRIMNHSLVYPTPVYDLIYFSILFSIKY